MGNNLEMGAPPGHLNTSNYSESFKFRVKFWPSGTGTKWNIGQNCLRAVQVPEISFQNFISHSRWHLQAPGRAVSAPGRAAKLLWLAYTPASSSECVMLLAVARRPGNLAQQA